MIREGGNLYRKRHSISVQTYNAGVSNPLLRLSIVAQMRKVINICTHGWKRKREGFNRRDRDLRSINCKFGFSMTAKPYPGCVQGWKIFPTIKDAAHNHRISKLYHMALPENCRIPSLNLVQQSMNTTGNNLMTRNLIEDTYEVFVTGKDYQNMKARVLSHERPGKTEDDLLYEFGREFKTKHENNGFGVIVGEANAIRSILVQSHCDKDIFNHHPEVLL